jgi:hypothetical protein
MTPELVGALHPDEWAARAMAFGLVVADVAKGRGWRVNSVASTPDVANILDDLDRQNPLFRAGPSVARYDPTQIAPRAASDFAGWVHAQRLEREPPLVAYELAVLALGVELPAVVLRSLRDASVESWATTFETPDGGGYATAFLTTYHPEWRGRGRIGTSTEMGTRLAAFASALRADTLIPTGEVVHVEEALPHPELPAIDLLLIYNPPSWYGDLASVRRRINPRHAILV